MFKDLYKRNALSQQQLQESRRRTLLQEQKRKRLELQDDQRELKFKSTPKKRGPRTFQQVYGSDVSLQLSEWLREQPEELADWFLVPCPRGQRCIVVASGKRSEMYNKAGRRCFTFRSLLPGDGAAHKTTTMLDCVYVRDQETFYVLDVISFANQVMLDCDAEFRFYWLRSKFEELEELGNCSTQNEKSFQLIERYGFENIERASVALQQYPLWPNNSPELDGLLFYHKEASYTCGTTPLVCWLFPFMVPDVLSMTVSSEYERPTDYSEPLQYMATFDARLSQKRQKQGSGVSEAKMDTTTQEASAEDATLQTLLDAERCLEMEEGVDCYERTPPERNDF